MTTEEEATMKTKDLDFEKALADLEQTVDKLEKGGLSLTESLALFEKGVKLARFLREELDRAEKKIDILLKDEKGGLRREAFDSESGADADDEDDDDEDEEGEDEGGAGADGENRPSKKAEKGKREPRKKPESGGDVLPF
jgi:exodeoxyribonuclease VII small subunit